MEFDEKNPWLVTNLNEFLYFCCPECPLKNHYKEEFINHALEFHPKAKNSLKSILFEDDSILQEDKTSNDFFENDCNASDSDLTLFKKEASDENEENSEFDYNEDTNFDDFETREIKSEEEITSNNDPTTNISDLQNQTVDEERKYNCEMCDKSYTQSHNLKTHIKKVHEGTKEKEEKGPRSDHKGIFTCNNCDKSYTQSHNLKTHIKNVHEGEKEKGQKRPKSVHDEVFNCNHCENKSFKTRHNLNGHIRAGN